MKDPELIEPQPIIIPDFIDSHFRDQSLLAEVLTRKGFTSIEQINKYLFLNKYIPANPFEFEDMLIAVEIILDAVKKQKTFGVWGDFDVDGISSTTILVQVLREACKAKVFFYIPNRERESHGIKRDSAFDFIQKNKIEILITCDTGIGEIEALEAINQLGVKTIITDHHMLPRILPKADAIINPHLLPESHACASLSGAGTAYMLARAISEKLQTDSIVYSDLAMLGTIADVVDLNGENRFIVQLGLNRFNSNPRPAWQSIRKQLNRENIDLNEEDIAFVIAPRINAAGRLEDANFLVDFILSENIQKTNYVALKLEGLNEKRKILVRQVEQTCEKKIANNPELINNPILILEGNNWPAGVLGLSANALVEKYKRPVIVFSKNGNNFRGSGRSYGKFNLYEAIFACRDLLDHFGGHPGATGLSMHAEQYPKFSKRIQISASAQNLSTFDPLSLVIDAFLPLANITNQLFDQIRLLAPFGKGNPAPIFAVKTAFLKKKGYLDKSKEHAIYTIADKNGVARSVIHWNASEKNAYFREIDLLFRLRLPLYSDNYPWLEWVAERPADSTPVSILQKKPVYFDFRAVINPKQILLDLLQKNPHFQLWGVKIDGIVQSNIKSTQQITKTEQLAIITPPAELIQISEIILKNKIQTVYFFGFPHPWDEAGIFLERLGGLVKYAFNNYMGEFRLSHVSDALGHKPAVVRTGLDWWNSSGKLTFRD